MMALSEQFAQYRRSQIAELRHYVEGEELSDRVSVSAPDRDAGSPKLGDMIARNPANHDDQWLVAAAYFAANFEPARQEGPAPALDAGVRERLEALIANGAGHSRGKYGPHVDDVLVSDLRALLSAPPAPVAQPQVQAEARIKELEAERDRCHARLEITQLHRFGVGGEEIVPIPLEDRLDYPDGIECRDETIRLQDKKNARLQARIKALEEALRPFALAMAEAKNAGAQAGLNMAACVALARHRLDYADFARARTALLPQQEGQG